MTMHDHNHNLGGKSHLIGMMVTGVVLLVVLLIGGRSIGEALPFAAALACPVMMIGMMFMMMRGKGKNSDAATHGHAESKSSPAPVASANTAHE